MSEIRRDTSMSLVELGVPEKCDVLIPEDGKELPCGNPVDFAVVELDMHGGVMFCCHHHCLKFFHDFPYYAAFTIPIDQYREMLNAHKKERDSLSERDEREDSGTSPHGEPDHSDSHDSE